MQLKYGVIGNPIQHTYSPEIHQAFAQQCKIDIVYDVFSPENNQFINLIHELINNQYRGVNITSPFKVAAYELCNVFSDRAYLAGSVNTLSFSDNLIYGDNTDGKGLTRDITNNIGISINNKSILLLGSGGAIRGILHELILLEPKNITIASRNIESSRYLINNYISYLDATPSVNLTSMLMSEISGCYDIVINGTSSSLENSALDLGKYLFKNAILAYDMTYNKVSMFSQYAQQQNISTYNGIGMLIEQASESFRIWHNTSPDTYSVLAKFQEKVKL